MELVAELALSSGRLKRGRVFRALLQLGGEPSSADVEAATGLTRPTVLQYLKELRDVGLINLTVGAGQSASRATVAQDFLELATVPLLKGDRG